MPTYSQLTANVPFIGIAVTVYWEKPRLPFAGTVTLVAVIANSGVEASAPTLKTLMLKAKINPKRANDKRRLRIAKLLSQAGLLPGQRVRRVPQANRLPVTQNFTPDSAGND
jgi:hypothetical protein